MIRVPMTREGLEKIRKEVEIIKSLERPKIIKEVEVAMAHGDLSENAEYHAAKEKLGHVNGRLQELEGRMAKAEVIDPSAFKGHTKVMFGAYVGLLDLLVDTEITYQIVGEFESDIAQGRISVASPIARSIIGKSKGDAVKVQTPKGIKEFEIVGVEYK